ncbi:MAG: tRNA uridine-5-carboxymethylaminomethyl(34) synthesis enzyme MnmG, partial [Thermodesulfovibrionales bacterium]
MKPSYDIIVIGGGHAGCEAALAASRMGFSTCMFTMNLDMIGQMPCNPAIGGLAKGHLVREIDALGGEMARAADAAGIQFRVLNRSKGPAVWSLRAQEDRLLYRRHMRRAVEAQESLDIKQGTIERIQTADGAVCGVTTSFGHHYGCRAVIVTTGTFLNGLIHVGLEHAPGGRAGEFPSVSLSDCLRDLEFSLGRLKTGTPPRLDARTIDFSRTSPQYGDSPPEPFSYETRAITNPQLPCYVTYTNPTTHELIRNNLGRSPLYSGRIKGVGPRYCPSIEDKVVRFAQKERHQIFLEPEGIETSEYYANGISTSLPYDVQIALVQSIEGLESAEIMRPGYAIEYDFVIPTQLRHSLETKRIRGLFLAGQINGTSGYEEAAAQGLIAGINAALSLRSEPPLILHRHEAYIGVLIDDLVTKGTSEPYRMFTSRAEYRLLLRHDNADMRLTEKGYRAGLISEERFDRFLQKKDRISREKKRLNTERLRPDTINPLLSSRGIATIAEPLTFEHLLRRPGIGYDDLWQFSPSEPSLSPEERKAIEIELKYQGYIDQQLDHVRRMQRLEHRVIPEDFDFSLLSGLSREVLAKLSEIRPASLGQALRIPGVTPAAVSLILVAV